MCVWRSASVSYREKNIYVLICSIQKQVVNCGTCIGKVESIRVEIQTTDGWYMEKIDVIDRTNNVIAATFPCSCWMDKNPGAVDGSAVQRTIFPGNTADERLRR